MAREQAGGMGKKRAEEGEEPEVFLGFGTCHQLKERGTKKRATQRAIGFVHFPERTEKAKARPARAQKPRKRRR